jgi:hypothetical protein
VTLLPAKRNGDLVLCGELTCPAVLGKVTGSYFVPTLGLVELRDPQGKAHEPPCYAQTVDVRRRVSTAGHTGRRISLFRRNLSAGANPEVTGATFAVLSRGDVWVKCPRGCKPITIVPKQ